MSSIASMYYERDLKMNIDPQYQIKHSLKKLGYLNTDYELNKQNYIKNKLSSKILLELDTELYINDLINQIKSSNEYLLYCQYLDNSIKRSVELEEYLISNNIKSFYDNCTEEELEYLGY